MTLIRYHMPLIYHTRHDEHILRVGETELPTSILHTLLEEIDGMILWESQGVFGLITNEVLRNLVTRYETARSIDELYPRTKTPANLTNLSWNQCIMVPQEVARVLLSAPHEQANNLRDSKTAAKTPDKDHAEHQ